MLRRLSAIALGMVVLAGMLVVTSSSASAAVPAGWYRIRNVGYPNDCMAVSTTNRIYNAPCGTQITERWQFNAAPAAHPANYRQLRNANGRCMDADNRGGRLTTIMHTYTCNGSPNQSWLYGDPGTATVGCVWVAYLCDWRPILAKGYIDLDPGIVWIESISLQPSTSSFSNQQWVVEPVPAP